MFRKNIFGFCLLLFIITGCQNNTKTDSGNDAVEKKDTVPAEPVRNSVSLLYDYNALEALFDNQNWMIAEKKDTVFLYVSRINPYLINTYSYRINKGDSVKNIPEPIQTDQQTRITWKWDNRNLALSNATKARAVWAAIGVDSIKYEFQKLDENRISLRFPDGKKVTLQKTHPISLFLIRSRYDYQNGTKLAFDSVQFNQKN